MTSIEENVSVAATEATTSSADALAEGEQSSGLITLSPHYAAVTAALDASDDPAEAARVLIGDLKKYVRSVELMTPNQMIMYLAGLAASGGSWEADLDPASGGSFGAVQDAAMTFRGTIEDIVREHVQERCDGDSEDADNRLFDEWIGDVVKSLLKECHYRDYYSE